MNVVYKMQTVFINMHVDYQSTRLITLYMKGSAAEQISSLDDLKYRVHTSPVGT